MPPKKRTSRKYVIDAENDTDIESESGSSTISAVPEASDVPSTLYKPGDEEQINPSHNILRRDILEVFVEAPRQKSDKTKKAGHRSDTRSNKAIKKSPRQSRFAGRIGLRCRFCKHLPSDSRANLATIYPETLQGIYRACNIRFAKRHVSSCQFIPASILAELDSLKEVNSRGSKSYWVESAKRIGLRDSEVNKGIVFCSKIQKLQS